jgi:alkylated DNA nucleotide flippase Atl1
MHQDAIVEIAPNRLRYFGGPGQMLLPSQATVAALVATVPQGKLITMQQILHQLAAQFGVRGTCPVTTRKALQGLAQRRASLPYWRVVKSSGELYSFFPQQAALLTGEGFTVTGAKVEGFKASLV